MQETDRQAGIWVSGYLQTMQDKSMLTAVGLKEIANGFEFENILKHDAEEAEDEWVIVDPSTLEYECVLDSIVVPMTHKTVRIGTELWRSRLKAHMPTALATALTQTEKALHICIRVKKGKTLLSGTFTPSKTHYPLGHPQGPKGYMVWVRGKELVFVRGNGEQLTYQADLIG